MSADVTCDLFIKGKKDRLAAVLGEILSMDHNGVSSVRFSRDLSDDAEYDDYTLSLGSDPWMWCYDSFIAIVRLTRDRYPEASIEGFFSNDCVDMCGGYANFEPGWQAYTWCVMPDDWEAYLAGNYAATWQAKVGMKITEDNQQGAEEEPVEK